MSPASMLIVSAIVGGTGYLLGYIHRGDVEAGHCNQSIKDIKRGRLVIDPRAWGKK